MALYHKYEQFNRVILVAERGQVLYERAFGQANLEWGIPNTLDTKFRNCLDDETDDGARHFATGGRGQSSA